MRIRSVLKRLPRWAAAGLLLFAAVLTVLFASPDTAPVWRSSGEIAELTVEKDPGGGDILRKTTADPGQISILTGMLETAVYRPGEPVPADALGGYLLTVTARYRDGSQQTALIQPRSAGTIYTTPGHEPGGSYVGEWPEGETFWDLISAPAETVSFTVPLLPEEADADSVLIYANDPWHGYRKKEITDAAAIREVLDLLSSAVYSQKNDTTSITEAWRLTILLRYADGAQPTIPIVISTQPGVIFVQEPSGEYFPGAWDQTGSFWDAVPSPAEEISREAWDAVHTLK